MHTRRLGLTLLTGGAITTLAALVWFFAAYADALELADDFMGGNYATRLMACLYASAAICQGAAVFSDTPAYTPVVFWIGVLSLLGGVVLLLAAPSLGPPASGLAGAPQPDLTGGDGRPNTLRAAAVGIVPRDQLTRYSYRLALGGAAAGLLLAPLALITLAGAALALLGLVLHRAQLSALDAQHLKLVCLIVATAAPLLLASQGTLLFLLLALAQIGAIHVAMRSYQAGRVLTTRNLTEACRHAFNLTEKT